MNLKKVRYYTERIVLDGSTFKARASVTIYGYVQGIARSFLNNGYNRSLSFSNPCLYVKVKLNLSQSVIS
jgi:hypothetical protein